MEMKKYTNRGSDTFQIILLLSSERRLALSHSNLRFSECQALAERIQGFLGSDVPIRAIDG
jgi:hypothetical protein